MRRTEVIEAIAGMIDQPPNKVNLSDPDLTIMVEIVKGVACLSVAPDYEKLCKYNLRMVAMSEEERKIAKSKCQGTPSSQNLSRTRRTTRRRRKRAKT